MAEAKSKHLPQMVWSPECSSGPSGQIVLRPEIDGLLDLYDRERNSSWGAWALGHVGCSSCGRQARRCELGGCGAWTQLACSMWNLPGPLIESILPVLTGGFPIPGPLGKS